MPDATLRREAPPARDPRATARFAAADELRVRGQHAAAVHAALEALAAHPYDADGHHVLARIYAASGDAARARDEWETALRLDPGHAGARVALAPHAEPPATSLEDEDTLPRGMRAVTAEVAAVAPAAVHGAPGAASAVRPTAAHPGMLSFADPRVVAALLTDRDGMVVAEHAQAGVGEMACQTLGAVLSSLAAETTQVLTALGMGQWRSLRVECASGALGLAPVSDEHVVILAVQSAMPLGLARRYLEAAQRHARAVLEDA